MTDNFKQLADRLVAIAGANGAQRGVDVEPRFYTAVTGVEGARPDLVLRPQSTDQVSQILAACNDAGQPLVMAGGRTGLVDATLPKVGEVVLSLDRMNAIIELDEAAATMTVEAGAILQTIQEKADDAGFSFPLDLGARGSCTIGGNISTNAGGNRVIRYGMTRELVLGLEVVQADGTILDGRCKLIKNNAGYDIKHLFIGSEGTLGVVTGATLRLHPKPKSQQVACAQLSSFRQVVAFLSHMQGAFAGGLTAFEVMWNNYYITATNIAGTAPFPVQTAPDSEPFYVLTEFLGGKPENDAAAFEDALGEALEAGIIEDAVIAKSASECEALWGIRDASMEVIMEMAPAIGYDISIPVGDMEAFVADLETGIAAKYPNSRTVIFGHLGDGNLHVGTDAGADTPETKAETNQLIYGLTGKYNGSISAEHGIGTQKLPYLKYSRSDTELALMRALKNTLDPKGILNPGRVLE